VAVVLDRAIDALRVDGARHAAVRLLVARVPAEERARLVGEAHLGERRARQRAVADPRAAVAARPRLDARTLAVHQDPGERRAQALLEGRRAARQRDRHGGEARAPAPAHGLELRLAPCRRLGAREAGGELRRRAEER
jgi:hypothetical protein